MQYFGLVKNNMMDIEKKRYAETPRERKLFYQVNMTLIALSFDILNITDAVVHVECVLNVSLLLHAHFSFTDIPQA